MNPSIRTSLWSPRAPRAAAVCLISALAFHAITTPIPAVVHLAANLGAPTWLLLGRTYWPGWWGGPIADHSPRYPAVRVFRQAVPGDWAPVVAQVAAALAAHPWPGCPAPQRVR